LSYGLIDRLFNFDVIFEPFSFDFSTSRGQYEFPMPVVLYPLTFLLWTVNSSEHTGAVLLVINPFSLKFVTWFVVIDTYIQRKYKWSNFELTMTCHKMFDPFALLPGTRWPRVSSKSMVLAIDKLAYVDVFVIAHCAAIAIQLTALEPTLLNNLHGFIVIGERKHDAHSLWRVGILIPI
jgi:hypothetical protein